MRLLDLFSGIGGFSLAATWVWGDDLEIVAFCEIDKYCQAVLRKWWPDVPIIEDIRDVTAETVLADTGRVGQFKSEKQTNSSGTRGTAWMGVENGSDSRRYIKASEPSTSSQVDRYHKAKTAYEMGCSISGSSGVLRDNPSGNVEDHHTERMSTNRIADLGHRPLLVVREKVGGGRQVAVDATGCIPGDWVICVGSSAAREAAGSKEYPSDLTIVGIIDHWRPDEGKA